MAWAKATNRVTGDVYYSATPDFEGDDCDVLLIVDDRCPEGLEQVDETGNIFIPLDALKAQLWAAVKAKRASLDSGSCSTPAGVVQCDPASKLNISGMVTMAMLALQQQQPFSVSFTMADNSTAALDAGGAIGMGMAVGEFVSACHDHAQALRASIDAAADADALATIDIETGWPE